MNDMDADLFALKKKQDSPSVQAKQMSNERPKKDFTASESNVKPGNSVHDVPA